MSLSGVRQDCRFFLQLKKLRKSFVSLASTLFSVVSVRLDSARSLKDFSLGSQQLP